MAARRLELGRCVLSPEAYRRSSFTVYGECSMASGRFEGKADGQQNRQKWFSASNQSRLVDLDALRGTWGEDNTTSSSGDANHLIWTNK